LAAREMVVVPLPSSVKMTGELAEIEQVNPTVAEADAQVVAPTFGEPGPRAVSTKSRALDGAKSMKPSTALPARFKFATCPVTAAPKLPPLDHVRLVPGPDTMHPAVTLAGGNHVTVVADNMITPDAQLPSIRVPATKLADTVVARKLADKKVASRKLRFRALALPRKGGGPPALT
jgi:hypothetical protein